jgi:hypothetical protein
MLALAAQYGHVAAGNFSGPAYGMQAHLVQSFNTPPSDSTVWTDVVEATYEGYLPQAVILPTTELDAAGSADGICGMLSWAPTGSTVDNVIAGVVYTDNVDGGTVLGVDVFDDVVPMAKPGDGFSLVPIIDLPWHEAGKESAVVI